MVRGTAPAARGGRRSTATPESSSDAQGCERCKNDHEKCLHRKDKSRCDRCENNDYPCILVVDDEGMNGKRRKLSRLRCTFCRSSKIKCLPEDRVWNGTPESRCEACKRADRPCSEPQLASQTRVTPTQPVQQVRNQMNVNDTGSIRSGSEDQGQRQPSVEGGAFATLPTPHQLYAATTTTYENTPHSVASRWLPAYYPPEMPIRFAEHDQKGHPMYYSYENKYSTDTGAEIQSLPKYEYQPLHGTGTFRLLKLVHADPGAELFASFMEYGHDTKENYYALSYTWGSDRPNKVLNIIDGQKPIQVLNVQEVVYTALQHIRKRNEDVRLWVDALCIDQENLPEKSAQIMEMGRIFAEAEKAIVWLDSGTSNTSERDNPVDLIMDLIPIRSFDKVVQEEPRKENWEAVVDLLRNKWFTRLWVIQQIVTAKRAVLHWGKKSIPWEDFADLVELLPSRVKRFPNLQQNADFLNPGYRGLPAPTLVHICNSLLWKTDNGDIISRRHSLETLVSLLIPFESMDPRDRIYGLLAIAEMAQATRDQTLCPDYTKNWIDVYFDFVEHCVKSSGSLDIICRHWAHTRPQKKGNRLERTSDNLPSWVLTSLGSPFATYGDPNNNYRLNGDSLVGLPNRKFYNAALGRSASADFKRKDQVNSTVRVLQVKGITVGTISATGGHASKGMVHGEWLDMVLKSSPKFEIGPSLSLEQLWRTLVADRDEGGEKAPRWYGRAFLECIQTPSQDMDIDTQKWISSNHTPTLIKDFLRRVQSIVWNRRLFITEDGRLGLGPRNARDGDLVCVLFGCSVPVLLRKHVAVDENCYVFIGEAYLHGIMDGQALFGKSDDEISQQVKTFEIH